MRLGAVDRGPLEHAKAAHRLSSRSQPQAHARASRLGTPPRIEPGTAAAHRERARRAPCPSASSSTRPGAPAVPGRMKGGQTRARVSRLGTPPRIEPGTAAAHRESARRAPCPSASTSTRPGAAVVAARTRGEVEAARARRGRRGAGGGSGVASGRGRGRSASPRPPARARLRVRSPGFGVGGPGSGAVGSRCENQRETSTKPAPACRLSRGGSTVSRELGCRVLGRLTALQGVPPPSYPRR